jgi:hypothetical protein
MNQILADAEAPTVIFNRITDHHGRHRADELPWAGITVDVIVAAAFRRLDRDHGYPTHSRSAT